MNAFFTKISQFLAAEDGFTAVQYAMMVLLVVLAFLTVITFIGQSGARNPECPDTPIERTIDVDT